MQSDLRSTWRIRSATVSNDTERWRLLAGEDQKLSFGQVFRHWKSSEAFRQFWGEGLRRVPFDAYCWECPPVTLLSLARPFECVFVASPPLAGAAPDPGPFTEHFRPGCNVATFESLGKDALLVAPCPAAQGSDFAHLSRFAATASGAQSTALWRGVGVALETRIDMNPTWLSTAGLGVSWLHVRLDNRPKYYRHAPYRSADR